MKKSIKRQLLLWLLIPLSSLAIISTVVSYYLGLTLARSIYDKQLSNSADSVVARMKIKNDKLTVDLPPAALAILKHNYHDEFYFQVISPDGKVISGDKFLPAPPTTNNHSIQTFAAVDGLSSQLQSEPSFRSIVINGKELRVVSLTVPTPDLPFDHALVQAAETRNTRIELAGQITMSILLAQIVLIACGAISIWIGVGRGLLPLARVEKVVANRSPGDLSPLGVDEPTEINSLIAALNRLFKQLDNDLELQRRFTSNAAHQLRTPLAVLGTYCDLARKMVKDNEVQEVLAELDGGINRMTKLVNRLLVLARSEPGVAAARPFAAVDLSAMASVVTAEQVPEAIRNKVELEFLAPRNPTLVFGDKGGLEEMLSNLIENSITYSNPGGKVSIEIQNGNGHVVLTVDDNGPGIDESERERIFERFYRITGTEKPGTGLGLAIVKEVAATHRAAIAVSTGRTGQGVSIAITFAAYKEG